MRAIFVNKFQWKKAREKPKIDGRLTLKLTSERHSVLSCSLDLSGSRQEAMFSLTHNRNPLSIKRKECIG
jgi:hypothetical protein